LKNAAYGVAYSTIQQTLVNVDAATAGKAAELKLSDPDYKNFRQYVTDFRALLLPAFQQDQKDAANAKTAAANAPKVAPAAPVAPIANRQS